MSKTKTFSDKQIHTIRRLLDLQRDLNNRIENAIQESLLRKELSDDELKMQLDSLKDSLMFCLDERL